MIYVGNGSIKVELDTHSAERARRLVDQIAPGVREALEREAKAVYDHAREEWPVRTGVSRDGLRWGVVVSPDLSSITGRVWDDVSYAKYVKARSARSSYRAAGGAPVGLSSIAGKSAFVELLRKPITARTKPLMVELAQIVGRRLG